MLEINLDHPVWLEPGGVGDESAFACSKNKCAIGKFAAAANIQHTRVYSELFEIIGEATTNRIWRMNDGSHRDETTGIVTLNLTPNHEGAVRLMLEELAKYPDKVKFVGTKVPQYFGGALVEK